MKTSISKHAHINRQKLIEALKIFGRSLTLRKVTRTLDNFGQMSARTTTDYTFRGDLQFGLDLDQRYLTTGLVEVGEGVLYVHPDAVERGTVTISLQDQVIDGNAVWEIVDALESPELDGTVAHLSFKCRRRINTSD